MIGTIDMIVLGLLGLLVIILWVFISKNAKLTEKNKQLQEVLEVKDITIANYEASRVAVSDVIDNFSSLEDVMALIAAGKSKEEVSKTLDIPLSKVELIVKFDKLKKRD